ncbi:gnat family [Ophiostoma piceae UAMH 11346]|uniref:Gnat family n=1 Tax=Ophiostoma piceae (strain UAMH 11346) TaxID=1262450 RepID=S3BPZ9_OPHP1|nr:gnat family [Ophiostoma piceae UAMH 11346]
MSFKPGSVTIRQLTVADRDSCVTVENSAFANPDHRATPEKFSYRLTVCPELCMGVFVRDGESSSETLVGHIVSTRLKTHVIIDDDMDVPPSWQDSLAAAPASATFVADVGHQPNGTTVGVHSLGVVPSAQGKGLGTKLMTAYLEHMAQLSAAAAASPSGSGRTKVSGVALICQDYLIKYYEKFGYKSHGPSKAHFGGGGWTDMVYDVPQ